MAETINYIDRDDLGLFCTMIESVTMTYNPSRTIKFEVVRPVDLSESNLQYNKGTLVFQNVIQSDIRLINERFEYPEFHRSAILERSELLTKTLKNKGVEKDTYKDYYLLIDHGNLQSEYHIICSNHDLILDTTKKFLEEFTGWNER